MKQNEKLDIILNELYKYKFDGKYYSFRSIFSAYNIEVEINELYALSKRLKNDGFIDTIGSHLDVMATLTTYGVEYCEESSYSEFDTPVYKSTIINIVNSPNSNIVNESNDVNINSSFNRIIELNNEIKELIVKNELDNSLILDKINEIENICKTNLNT